MTSFNVYIYIYIYIRPPLTLKYLDFAHTHSVYVFHVILTINIYHFLNSINQVVFVRECSVFSVRYVRNF